VKWTVRQIAGATRRKQGGCVAERRSGSELPPQSEIVFALGIAYPMRARIAGHASGAKQKCASLSDRRVQQLEQITVWDELGVSSSRLRHSRHRRHEWKPLPSTSTRAHREESGVSERGEV